MKETWGLGASVLSVMQDARIQEALFLFYKGQEYSNTYPQRDFDVFGKRQSEIQSKGEKWFYGSHIK